MPSGYDMKVRARVAYHGAPFHGFADNPGVSTVAGVLNESLSRAVGERVTVTCAGRTDRGVHAVGQVVSFDVPESTDLATLVRSVNSQCAPAVAVANLVVVADDFDARFSATGRTYRYQILNRPEPDPLLADRAWHVPQPLDVEAMTAAGQYLLGVNDFAAFCRRPRTGRVVEPSLVRRVEALSWTGPDDDGILIFEITASSFCHQMVRSIVGTLVVVGHGQRMAADIPSVIAAGNRQAAGPPAPPHGLVLWSVRYGLV